MSIDTGSIIIVGVLYTDELCLDEMIEDGELAVSSIWYDSPRDANIVGKIVAYSYGIKELDVLKLQQEILEATEYLVQRGFLRSDIKTYLSLDIT